MLSNSNQPLSELWKPFGHYTHSGEINFHVENTDAVIQKIRQRFSDATISELDGVLFEYPEYWISVRKSNTEPVLRLNVEAHDEKKMKEIVEEIRGLIAL